MIILKKLIEENRKLELKLKSINDLILKQLDFVLNDSILKMLKELRKEYLLVYSKIMENDQEIYKLKQQQKTKNIKVIGSI